MPAPSRRRRPARRPARRGDDALELHHLAVAGRKGAAEFGHRPLLDRIELGIGARRVMVEQRQLPGARRLAELDALLPGRVAIAALAHHLLLGIGAVVDDQVGLADQGKHVRIELARLVLGIGDHRHRAAAPLDPVADAAARMIETAGAHCHPGAGPQDIARTEIATIELRPADVQADRKPWRPHEIADHLVGRHAPGEMPRMKHHMGLGIIDRIEERQPKDVVVVRMGEEDVELVPPLGAQLLAGRADTGSGVEEQHMRPATDLERDGVAAEADIFGPRDRHAAANTPKSDAEEIVVHGAFRWLPGSCCVQPGRHP